MAILQHLIGGSARRCVSLFSCADERVVGTACTSGEQDIGENDRQFGAEADVADDRADNSGREQDPCTHQPAHGHEAVRWLMAGRVPH